MSPEFQGLPEHIDTTVHEAYDEVEPSHQRFDDRMTE
jgi:hypothetical protein